MNNLQKSFLKALANIGSTDPVSASDVVKLASTTYGVSFPEKSLPKQVLNKLVEDYLHSEKPQTEGLPTVAYFADKICLSPGYFGELIKKETGQTAQAYIPNKLIDVAKEELLGTTLTVNEIASRLGFQYPHHFSRIFKKTTGHTPTEYKLQT